MHRVWNNQISDTKSKKRSLKIKLSWWLTWDESLSEFTAGYLQRCQFLGFPGNLIMIATLIHFDAELQKTFPQWLATYLALKFLGRDSASHWYHPSEVFQNINKHYKPNLRQNKKGLAQKNFQRSPKKFDSSSEKKTKFNEFQKWTVICENSF